MQALPKAMGIADPNAALEMAFIKEYLGDHTPKCPLTREEGEQIWKNALLYAALRLEEVAARAHLVDALHGRPRYM
jgi:hypothetical protein